MWTSAGGPGSGMCVCALKLGKELGSVPAYEPYKLVKRTPSKTHPGAQGEKPAPLVFPARSIGPGEAKIVSKGACVYL